ncbi:MULTISPECIES: hypothetical protein [unclassified Blastococcus]
MSTIHRHDQFPVTPVRCLRHHVWMAACPDCRDAHRTPAHRTPGARTPAPRRGAATAEEATG